MTATSSPAPTMRMQRRTFWTLRRPWDLTPLFIRSDYLTVCGRCLTVNIVTGRARARAICRVHTAEQCAAAYPNRDGSQPTAAASIQDGAVSVSAKLQRPAWEEPGHFEVDDIVRIGFGHNWYTTPLSLVPPQRAHEARHPFGCTACDIDLRAQEAADMASLPGSRS